MNIKNKFHERISDEEVMLSNIEKSFSSGFVIEILKRIWEESHNINYIGKIIGEVYTINIINKNGYGFETYMREIVSLYRKLIKKQISPERFNLEKSKLISITIAKKIGIDTNREVTNEDLEKIKSYFLREYVQNGYVSHSFPDTYRESIMSDGLVSEVEDRKDKPQEIQEIQDMFMSKGIVAPLGGYPFYDGHGIYFEHDFLKVFHHAIYSPEWFTWFTSSNHIMISHNDIESTPAVLRNEEVCRRNIYDLCQNAELSDEETKKVIDFFNKNYEKFKSPKLSTALISKKKLGKNDISKALPQDMDLLSTITYVLSDGAKEYVEHQGNVYIGRLTPKDFKVTSIPEVSKYIKVERYTRETKEHLRNPSSNLRIINNAEKNRSRMNPIMERKVQMAKKILEEQEKKLQEQERLSR